MIHVAAVLLSAALASGMYALARGFPQRWRRPTKPVKRALALPWAGALLVVWVLSDLDLTPYPVAVIASAVLGGSLRWALEVS